MTVPSNGTHLDSSQSWRIRHCHHSYRVRYLVHTDAYIDRLVISRTRWRLYWSLRLFGIYTDCKFKVSLRYDSHLRKLPTIIHISCRMYWIMWGWLRMRSQYLSQLFTFAFTDRRRKPKDEARWTPVKGIHQAWKYRRTQYEGPEWPSSHHS